MGRTHILRFMARHGAQRLGGNISTVSKCQFHPKSHHACKKSQIPLLYPEVKGNGSLAASEMCLHLVTWPTLTFRKRQYDFATGASKNWVCYNKYGTIITQKITPIQKILKSQIREEGNVPPGTGSNAQAANLQVNQGKIQNSFREHHLSAEYRVKDFHTTNVSTIAQWQHQHLLHWVRGSCLKLYNKKGWKGTK